jgi:hypothetical protein
MCLRNDESRVSIYIISRSIISTSATLFIWMSHSAKCGR